MGKLPSRLQPWHDHVMKTKSQHPDKKFKDILKIAKRSFKRGSSHSKSSSSSLNIKTTNYNIRVKSKKNRRLSKKVTRRTSRKASKKKSRRRKKRSFGLF